jgi:peptidoglycan/LPS O-acetylase OafA/YrhL
MTNNLRSSPESLCESRPLLEHEDSIATKRFLVLDGWRGLCALLVAVHNVNFGPWIPQRSLVAHSSLFVDFFFVLSGFVISHAYAGKLHRVSDLTAFMLRRFGRLWPLHVAVLVSLVILHFAKISIAGIAHLELDADVPNAVLSVRTISTNLLFIQIFDVRSWLSWNAPSWSISAEFWTYLTFAAGYLIFSTERTHALLVGAIAVSAAGLIFFRSADFLETNTSFAFFRCLYGFSVGHLTYRAFRSLPAKSGSILELSVVLLVASYVTFTGNDITSMIAPAIFGFSIWVFAQEHGIVSWSMKTRAFVRLGTWSYSIYMVHWILRNFLVRANEIVEKLIARHSIPSYFSMTQARTQLIVIAVYLIVTVIMAAVAYRWIEQPGRRYFNRWAEKLSASVPEKKDVCKSAD